MKTNNIHCDTCKNADCFIAKHCSSKWKRIVDKERTLTVYRKGQLIINEGTTVFGIFFIYSGKIKVFKSSINGKIHILRLAKTGKILGHRGIGGKTVYPIGAAALEDSSVCFIENDLFFKLLQENATITFHLMMFYAEELKKSETRMKNLAHMNVKDRVIEALLLICDAYGIQKKDGSFLLDVSMTRQEIADIASTTQEQVIRTLSELKQNEVIKTEGKKIFILEYQKLLDYIDDYDINYLSLISE